MLTFFRWNSADDAIVWNFRDTATFRWRHQSWADSIIWLSYRRLLVRRRLRHLVFTRTANSLRSVVAIGIRLPDELDVFRVLLSLNERLQHRWTLLHSWKGDFSVQGRTTMSLTYRYNIHCSRLECCKDFQMEPTSVAASSFVALHHCSTSTDFVRFFYFHNFSDWSAEYQWSVETDPDDIVQSTSDTVEVPRKRRQIARDYRIFLLRKQTRKTWRNKFFKFKAINKSRFTVWMSKRARDLNVRVTNEPDTKRKQTRTANANEDLSWPSLRSSSESTPNVISEEKLKPN